MASIDPSSGFSGSPIFSQHTAHRHEGLSPSRISFTIDHTAGDFEQARQISRSCGVCCNKIGYPVRGSEGCIALKVMDSVLLALWPSDD